MRRFAVIVLALVAVGSTGCVGDDEQGIVDAVNDCGRYNGGAAKVEHKDANDFDGDSIVVTCRNGEKRVLR